MDNIWKWAKEFRACWHETCYGGTSWTSAHIVWVTGILDRPSTLFTFCGMGKRRNMVLGLLENMVREANGRLSLYV